MVHNYSQAVNNKSAFFSPGSDGKSASALVKVGIVGARGYSGQELARILLRHPSVELTECYATDGFSLEKILGPAFSGLAKPVLCQTENKLSESKADLLFFATPAEVSHKMIPEAVSRGQKVIDLSGAYRLSINSYDTWYHFRHQHPEILEQSVYGLAPWQQPSPKAPQVIANPGCYATAVLMGLLPLIKDNLIQADTLVIDAKSGTTGAGKKASENMLFSEVDTDCLPYRVGRHQHLPEITQAVFKFTGQQIDPHFVTSLLPVRRGIIAGLYAKLNAGVSLKQVTNAFVNAYDQDSLISFGECEEQAGLMSLKRVVGTARTHISFQVVDQKLYVFSCLDNLLKGAASQAVENMNQVHDWPRALGLQALEAMA